MYVEVLIVTSLIREDTINFGVGQKSLPCAL